MKEHQIEDKIQKGHLLKYHMPSLKLLIGNKTQSRGRNRIITQLSIHQQYHFQVNLRLQIVSKVHKFQRIISINKVFMCFMAKEMQRKTDGFPNLLWPAHFKQEEDSRYKEHNLHILTAALKHRILRTQDEKCHMLHLF